MKAAAKVKSKPIMQLFVDYGWPINQKLGWYDPPALAYAVEDEDLTTWFLTNGASPNAKCKLDKTPLSAAM